MWELSLDDLVSFWPWFKSVDEVKYGMNHYYTGPIIRSSEWGQLIINIQPRTFQDCCKCFMSFGKKGIHLIRYSSDFWYICYNIKKKSQTLSGIKINKTVSCRQGRAMWVIQRFSGFFLCLFGFIFFFFKFSVVIWKISILKTEMNGWGLMPDKHHHSANISAE